MEDKREELFCASVRIAVVYKHVRATCQQCLQLCLLLRFRIVYVCVVS